MFLGLSISLALGERAIMLGPKPNLFIQTMFIYMLDTENRFIVWVKTTKLRDTIYKTDYPVILVG